MDFGKLKPVKAWLESLFDHTLLLDADDPLLPEFRALEARGACRLVVLADSCGTGLFPVFAPAWAFWAEPNNVVLLQPCVGGSVDTDRFPAANEVQRGLLDVYGQLGIDYATQSGPHMKTFGNILKAVLPKNFGG